MYYGLMVRLTDFFFNLTLNYRLSCLNNVIFDFFFGTFMMGEDFTTFQSHSENIT